MIDYIPTDYLTYDPYIKDNIARLITSFTNKVYGDGSKGYQY